MIVHAESFMHYSILELYIVKEHQHDVCVKTDAAMLPKLIFSTLSYLGAM